jgi:hypothetical protein
MMPEPNGRSLMQLIRSFWKKHFKGRRPLCTMQAGPGVLT